MVQNIFVVVESFFISKYDDRFSGFPCPLCRSPRNGVLPFAPRSFDALVENLLQSFPNQLLEDQSASNNAATGALAAFIVCLASFSDFCISYNLVSGISRR